MVKLETHHPRIYAEIVEIKQVKFGWFVSFNRKDGMKNTSRMPILGVKKIWKNVEILEDFVDCFQRFCDLTFI